MIKLASIKKIPKYLTHQDINDSDFRLTLDSPLGRLCIITSEKGLKAIHLIGDFEPENHENEHTHHASTQLQEYFSGRLFCFELTFDTAIYSDFANRVWSELVRIPYGKTISYSELALRLGDPLCIRAAASANGRNPIPIIIPCHRVIGSDGSLTGFAWGLDIKQRLLAHENPARFGVRQIDIFA